MNKHSLPFHRALVEEFFRRPWLMFHSLIVERADVDMTKHARKDEAERKHFPMHSGVVRDGERLMRRAIILWALLSACGG